MKRKSDAADVFISTGAAYTDQQRIFIEHLEDLMLANECKLRQIGHVRPGDMPISVVANTKRLRRRCYYGVYQDENRKMWRIELYFRKDGRYHKGPNYMEPA